MGEYMYVIVNADNGSLLAICADKEVLEVRCALIRKYNPEIRFTYYSSLAWVHSDLPFLRGLLDK